MILKIDNITKQDLNSYNVKATSMRTHTCGQVGSCLIGEVVEVCGWTQSIRSISSGLSFIKLRDIDGSVQIVLDKQTLSKDNGQIWEVLRDLPVESVVKIKGVVKKQPGGKKKGDETNFDHSLVEIVASDVTVLNTARNLPFNLHTKEKL
ncbi:Aspartate-tRNA ligase [Zancudomyces culisetae]|uniref:Aspartate-tRNA ligase n=1 Tax=Zancudomyces culisetae TaxID=1213189 RepID=A0A1R1PP18_ZANCU|nr:Aspartate-tRNA ligase [Zancudomyces culisetae]|eukprot:OMH82726.1 Aspartate-tRNA ligase [Zancudomyces culisetae]